MERKCLEDKLRRQEAYKVETSKKLAEAKRQIESMSSQKGELNDKLKGQQNKVKKLVSCFVRRHNTTSAKESTIGIFVNVV